MSRLNQLLKDVYATRPAKPYLCQLHKEGADYHPCDPVNTSGTGIFGGVYITCEACPFDSPKILQKFLENICPDSLP